jgi:hypothetical protein
MAQFIATKNYGIIEVECSWQVAQKQDSEGNLIQQGGHIARLVNGVYCDITGNPFKSEDEIRGICSFADGRVIPKMEQVLADSLEWFAHRFDNLAEAIPEVTFDHNGFPKYADGNYLETEDEIYKCLKPGAVMTAAIVGLSERRKMLREAEAAKPVFEEREQAPAMEHEVAAPVERPRKLIAPGRGRKKGTKVERGAKGQFQPKNAPPAQAAEAVTA